MLVVDVQGFKTSANQFTPKELAVYDGNRCSHHIFKPPFPWASLQSEFQKQATWLIRNHHCIAWEEGFTPQFLFSEILRRETRDADAVYVKGLEKSTFIRKHINKPVVEIAEQPALLPMEPSCFYHSNSLCYCALSNVKHLYHTYVME